MTCQHIIVSVLQSDGEKVGPAGTVASNVISHR